MPSNPESKLVFLLSEGSVPLLESNDWLSQQAYRFLRAEEPDPSALTELRAILRTPYVRNRLRVADLVLWHESSRKDQIAAWVHDADPALRAAAAQNAIGLPMPERALLMPELHRLAQDPDRLVRVLLRRALNNAADPVLASTLANTASSIATSTAMCIWCGHVAKEPVDACPRCRSVLDTFEDPKGLAGPQIVEVSL